MLVGIRKYTCTALVEEKMALLYELKYNTSNTNMRMWIRNRSLYECARKVGLLTKIKIIIRIKICYCSVDTEINTAYVEAKSVS